ncbi:MULTISPECIES: pilus assembly protein [unclassified Actinotalea]|uniref:pilus assembly protein n=1 Tax=unclassified Actinotalea TaxID=2638618 RepID=UPI002107DC86|nr:MULTISPECIES: pilus assembly protein [unclassified Actinotalea]
MTCLRAARAAAARFRTRVGTAAAPADAGSAVVEFLGVALLLLVPTVYLVLVLGRLQSAAFAVDGGAREAVRAFVTADDDSSGTQRALAAAGLALADQGLDPEAVTTGLRLACGSQTCLVPGTRVTAELVVEVPLPGVPAWLGDVVPLAVAVTADATGVVDEFRDVG